MNTTYDQKGRFIANKVQTVQLLQKVSFKDMFYSISALLPEDVWMRFVCLSFLVIKLTFIETWQGSSGEAALQVTNRQDRSTEAAERLHELQNKKKKVKVRFTLQKRHQDYTFSNYSHLFVEAVRCVLCVLCLWTLDINTLSLQITMKLCFCPAECNATFLCHVRVFIQSFKHINFVQNHRCNR